MKLSEGAPARASLIAALEQNWLHARHLEEQRDRAFLVFMGTIGAGVSYALVNITTTPGGSVQTFLQRHWAYSPFLLLPSVILTIAILRANIEFENHIHGVRWTAEALALNWRLSESVPKQSHDENAHGPYRYRGFMAVPLEGFPPRLRHRFLLLLLSSIACFAPLYVLIAGALLAYVRVIDPMLIMAGSLFITLAFGLLLRRQVKRVYKTSLKEIKERDPTLILRANEPARADARAWWKGMNPNAKLGFDNSPFVSVAYWPFRTAGDGLGIQSRVKLRDGVTVVALDSESRFVYAIRNVRHSETGPVTTLEMPNGGIEEGDRPLDAARKELTEEAGVVEENEASWVALSPSDGFNPIDGLVVKHEHVLLLLCGKRVREPSSDEKTSVLPLALSELIAMDERNEIRDPLNGYALRRAHSWLAKNRPDLLT